MRHGTTLCLVGELAEFHFMFDYSSIGCGYPLFERKREDGKLIGLNSKDIKKKQ